MEYMPGGKAFFLFFFSHWGQIGLGGQKYFNLRRIMGRIILKAKKCPTDGKSGSQGHSITS
jgi:hypothetical protein